MDTVHASSPLRYRCCSWDHLFQFKSLQSSCWWQKNLQAPLKVKRDLASAVSGLYWMISVTVKKILKLGKTNCLPKVSLTINYKRNLG